MRKLLIISMAVILALCLVVLAMLPALGSAPVLIEAGPGVVSLALQQDNVGSYTLTVTGLVQFHEVVMAPSGFVSYYNVQPDRVLVSGFMTAVPMDAQALLSILFTTSGEAVVNVSGCVYDPDGVPFPVDASITVGALGDANSDGDVNILDAMSVAQFAVGVVRPIDLAAADVNRDGQVTVVDAMYVAQYTVGQREL